MEDCFVGVSKVLKKIINFIWFLQRDANMLFTAKQYAPAKEN